MLVKFVSATGDPHWRGVDDAAIAPMHTHIERRAAAAESGGSGGDERGDEHESVARDLFRRRRLVQVVGNGSATQTDDSDELDALFDGAGPTTEEDEDRVLSAPRARRNPHRRNPRRRDADMRDGDDDDEAPLLGEGSPVSISPNGDGTTEGDDASDSEGEEAAAGMGNLQLNAGDHIDCRNRSGRWLEAVVAGVGFGRVLIHFKGWFEAQEYDDWVTMGSARMQLRGTHTAEIREQAAAMAGALGVEEELCLASLQRHDGDIDRSANALLGVANPFARGFAEDLARYPFPVAAAVTPERRGDAAGPTPALELPGVRRVLLAV